MRAFVLLLMIVIGLFSVAVAPLQAAGVVGTGTSGSCTEAAFDAALSSGGAVTFNCGAARHIIAITGSKTIRADTRIDGGGLITLDGGAYTLIFYNLRGVTLNLQNITLQNARSIDGGAIKNDGGILQLRRVTLRRNESVRPAPDSSSGSGGAIYNADGSLEIANSRFYFNRADESGGAIYTTGGSVLIMDSVFLLNSIGAGGQGGGAISSGSPRAGLPGSPVRIENSQFVLNIVPLSGGAISSDQGGTLEMYGSTLGLNLADKGGALLLGAPDAYAVTSEYAIIRDSYFAINVAFSDGGAVHSIIPTVIEASEFRNNVADYGGGVYIETISPAQIRESVFWLNRARQDGGAIYSRYTETDDSITVQNTTISGNRASRFGGGWFDASTGLNTWLYFSTVNANRATEGANIAADAMRVVNSIIANPLGGSNCRTALTLEGVNVIFPASCGGGIAADPLLDALRDNGGQTRTHALRRNSPAIDAAPDDCPLTYDQRYFLRPIDGTFDGVARCDVGAYEYLAIAAPVREPMPLTEPLIPPTPTRSPPVARADCESFRATSPRDGLPNGVVTFYWDAAPGATDYRIVIFNETQQQVGMYSVAAPATTVSADVSQGAIGGGISFTYEVQALVNGQAVCRSSVTLLRESPNVPPPAPQCGNGIQEPGETPNSCPNGY